MTKWIELIKIDKTDKITKEGKYKETKIISVNSEYKPFIDLILEYSKEKQ